MNEWISVKDRLPELDKPWGEPKIIGHYAEVLAFDGNRVISASLDKRDRDPEAVWASTDGAMLYNVTHWMPLPEPPKERA